MDSCEAVAMSCSSCRQGLLSSAFLAQVLVQKGIAMLEFSAVVLSEAFGKVLQQVLGVVHRFGKPG